MSCWSWVYSVQDVHLYCNIGVCLSWKVLLPNLRCMQYEIAISHTHLLFEYTAIAMMTLSVLILC